jgi:hypothetical protein
MMALVNITVAAMYNTASISATTLNNTSPAFSAAGPSVRLDPTAHKGLLIRMRTKIENILTIF